MGALYHVRDHRPLQQGLRLLVTKPLSLYLRMVRDHRPLQQGLRPFSKSANESKFSVRDHRPLQQGLRLETIKHSICEYLDMYETIVHYNKD